MPINSTTIPTKRRGSEISTVAVNSSVAASDNGNKNAVVISGKTKIENFQADREVFLNAFEKPTQIYRFLRSRMVHSPLFLQRNLSYMKNRMSRSHKSRANFRIDNILEMVTTKLDSVQRNKLSGKAVNKNYYNIILLGFSDGQKWAPDTKAKVELQIARVCLKKRKEVKAPITKAFDGTCEVKVYSPPTDAPPSITNVNNSYNVVYNGKCPVISVPSECFNLVNGHVVRSYVLVVKVTVPKYALMSNGANAPNKSSKSSTQNSENGEKSPATSTSSSSSSSSLVNSRNPCAIKNSSVHRMNSRNSLSNHKNESSNSNRYQNNTDDDEPKTKRRRSAPPRDRENFIYGSDGQTANEDIVFLGQITIYDKQLNVGLGNTDYEVTLKQTSSKRSSMALNRLKNQETSWESLDVNHPKVLMFANKPIPTGRAKLSVAIRTSASKMSSYIEPPAPISAPGISWSEEDGDGTTNEDGEGEMKVRVIYQFLHSNSSRQQTEARNDLRCPWCSLNCVILYSLFKHLKMCHPRFHFIYVPLPYGARVDVAINESFDGSYTGSAYDLVAQPPGEAFARNGPTKRTKVFSVLVCRPDKLVTSLQEFLENDEKDVDQRRTYITGHNRLYHHTTTCLPIHPKEIDIDSEGEPDPEWLRVKTAMMIDEFTDVNEGEKELMKMWNLHVLKYNYVGDCQIPLACKRFVELQGKELIRKNLYRNFILHLTSLYDFGLLSPHGIYTTVQLLHSQMKENNTAISLRDCWKAHLTQGPNLNFAAAVKEDVSDQVLGIRRLSQNNNYSTATSIVSSNTANAINSNTNGIHGSLTFPALVQDNTAAKSDPHPLQK